jgi:hypothetical protein
MIIMSLLSNNFQNYLIDKLTTTEEKQFGINFNLFLEHGDDNTIFPVDFDNVLKWCEFNKKYNAKQILLKNFTENKDYKIFLEDKTEKDLNTKKIEDEIRSYKMDSDLLEVDKPIDKRLNNGGQNKEQIMLNIDTFKEFCMKASTPKAKEIRIYYIKLEKIFFSYTKEQLQKSNEKLLLTLNNLDINKNNIFKTAYNKKKIVYIIKLQTFEDESYIIKIGKSDDLRDRILKMSSQYGCTEDKPLKILHIFQCENNYQFEQFLHNDPYIKSFKYTNLINDIAKSTETYHIKSEDIYKKIIRTGYNNMIFYNHKSIEELKECNKASELLNRNEEIKLKEKELEFNTKLLDNPELLQIKFKKEEKELEFKEKELEFKEKELEFKEKELEFNTKLLDNPEILEKYTKMLIEKNKVVNIPIIHEKNEIIEENINQKNEIIEENEIIPIIKKYKFFRNKRFVDH